MLRWQVMHGFSGILFCGIPRNPSKTTEILCKWSQTYWHLSNHGYIKPLEIWISCKPKDKYFDIDSSSHFLVGESEAAQMEVLNMRIVWTIICRFDAHIHWHLFFLNQTKTICAMSASSMHYLIQWKGLTADSFVGTGFLHYIFLGNNWLERQN